MNSIKPTFNDSTDINNIYIIDDTLKLREVHCKCCKRAKFSPRMVEPWRKLRTRVAQPIVVTSGYRCWEHHVNEYKRKFPLTWREKLTTSSFHLTGEALDLRVPKGLTAVEFLNLALWSGFTYGYIIDENHIHVDVGMR